MAWTTPPVVPSATLPTSAGYVLHCGQRHRPFVLPHAYTVRKPRRSQLRCSVGEPVADAVKHAAVLPASADMPYPGEDLTLSLSGLELRALAAASMANQSTGGATSSALLFLPRMGVDDNGALLAVSQARAGDGDVAHVSTIMLSRARIARAADGNGVACTHRVGDWPVWDGATRAKLAGAMHKAADLAREVRKLRVRIDDPKVDGEDETWLRLIGVAPDRHDLELTAEEWAATPSETRETWCRRAECFSFAAVRFAGGNDDAARRRRQDAWNVTETETRIAIAMELLAVAKAEAAAKVSIKNAFGR